MKNIGITMGCPVGIGPEIIIKYFQSRPHLNEHTPVVIGDINILRHCLGLQKDLELVTWNPGDSVKKGTIPVFCASDLDPSSLSLGEPTRDTAEAMVAYIQTAVRLVQEGFLSGITTCPISKFALNQTGSPFPGHTEMLAHLTQTEQYGMMMAGSKLRVTLVTIHCPMAEVSSILSSDSIFDLIALTHDSLNQDFGIKKPKLGVAGFNPHAGEEEMFGSEEKEYIVPAVDKAQRLGINAHGPYPPDTIFYQAIQGKFHAVVCMYHDQGLIPFKLLHFEDGVNVTLGLPIVRTSVDHGTAYDIAGKGIADHGSLNAAVELAWTICKNRNKLQS